MNKMFFAIGVIACVLTGAGLKASLTSLDKRELEETKVLESIKSETKETSVLSKEERFELEASQIYTSLTTNYFDLPAQQIFYQALKGYFYLQEKGELLNNKLTIVDFSTSSTKKRLWVIDMDKYEIVLQSYVAHGMKTGQEFASTFSNTLESHMSSLGFYKTAEVYHGINGLSLRLDGLEKGINDNARKRAIVIHGAKYASENIIKAQGRLGRSFGCPAVPVEVNKELIDLIKDKSCLFIYHDNAQYKNKTTFV